MCDACSWGRESGATLVNRAYYSNIGCKLIIMKVSQFDEILYHLQRVRRHVRLVLLPQHVLHVLLPHQRINWSAHFASVSIQTISVDMFFVCRLVLGIHTHSHACMYAYTHTHTHIRMHTHRYTHTHTHNTTHTHTRTPHGCTLMQRPGHQDTLVCAHLEFISSSYIQHGWLTGMRKVLGLSTWVQLPLEPFYLIVKYLCAQAYQLSISFWSVNGYL